MCDHAPARMSLPVVKVVVVVLNWNGLSDTIECIDALLSQTYRSRHIVLIDNGSDGDDYEQLQARYGDIPEITLCRNAANLGFTRGVNRALRQLVGVNGLQYIALLNNDAVPELDWLARIIETAETTGAAAVASKMVNYYDCDHLDNAGHIFLSTGEVLPRGGSQPVARFSNRATVIGPCAGAALYRTSLFWDIGLFDEYFVSGYEDAEFGLRATLGGYSTAYDPTAVVYHKISRSVDKIRDLNYAVKLAQDINYTYIKLMPGPLLWGGAPLLLTKVAVICITAAVLGRWRLLRVQYLALRSTWQQRAILAEYRREHRGFRRLSSFQVWRLQTCFLPTYIGYFRRYILRRKPTVFER